MLSLIAVKQLKMCIKKGIEKRKISYFVEKGKDCPILNVKNSILLCFPDLITKIASPGPYGQ